MVITPAENNRRGVGVAIMIYQHLADFRMHEFDNKDKDDFYTSSATRAHHILYCRWSVLGQFLELAGGYNGVGTDAPSVGNDFACRQ